MINQPGSTWECPQCGEINDIADRDCPNCHYINPYRVPPPLNFDGRTNTPQSSPLNAIVAMVLGLLLGGIGLYAWRDSVSNAQADQGQIQAYQSDCSSAFVVSQTAAVEQAQSAGDSAYWQYLDQHAGDPCRVESVSGYFYYRPGTKGSSAYRFHRYPDHNFDSNDFTIVGAKQNPPPDHPTGPIYLELWNDRGTAVTVDGERYVFVGNPLVIAYSRSGLPLLTGGIAVVGFIIGLAGLFSLIRMAIRG